MNKLVIIGNGFDLAHGLETSYQNFIIWYLNKVISTKNQSIDKSLIYLDYIDNNRNNPNYNFYLNKRSYIETVSSIEEFEQYKKKYGLKATYISKSFVVSILEKIELLKWVDIEKEYYDLLVKIYKPYEQYGRYDAKELYELNKALYLIELELKGYLENHLKPPFAKNQSIKSLFDSEILNDPNEDVYVLNFNYTSFVETYLYLPKLKKSDNKSTLKSGIKRFQYTKNEISKTINVYLNNIHGKLYSDNQLIFGYGDETDEYYEKLENLKDNEFLKHMKSFGYLQSSNYNRLFEFLDQEKLHEDKRKKIDVYIMGHSCGVSDRLLFTHIFEHPLMNSVTIYYYERPDGTNDFYEKTQDLSRHFRKDAKHRMRKCILPFSESKPLPQFKQQN